MRRALLRLSLSIAALTSLAWLAAACSSSTASAPGASSAGEAGADASEVATPTSDGSAPTGGEDGGAPPSYGSDAGSDASPSDQADGGCSVSGVVGQCINVSACAALTGCTSTPGHCPGAADIECCTMTPSVADNPPIPAGYQLMAQADVTSAMTTWAVAILDDPTDYPMFSTTTKTFGTQLVLARVEWHPPDFQNSVVHRGVTLYVPT